LKSDRYVVGDIADSHCGHLLGLLNPETVINLDGVSPKKFQLGITQQHLWRRFMTCLDELEDLAGGSPTFLFFNGDITHGTKYLEAVFAVSIMEQVQIARWCIQEALNRKKLKVKAVRFLLGTAAHNLDGTTEQFLCELLSALYPRISFGVCDHALYEMGVGGATFDVAHHGPSVGTRSWTEPNVARAYTLSLMMREIAKGREPPQVVLRAHRHRAVKELVNYEGRDTWVVVTPSLCGMNGHGLQMTQSLDEQDHGIFGFAVEGKKVQVVPMYETIDLRLHEVLT
jgi:hypothetical protein